MSDNGNQGGKSYLSVGRLGNIKAVQYSGGSFSVKDALEAAEIKVENDEEVIHNDAKVENYAKTLVSPGDTILIMAKIEGND